MSHQGRVTRAWMALIAVPLLAGAAAAEGMARPATTPTGAAQASAGEKAAAPAAAPRAASVNATGAVQKAAPAVSASTGWHVLASDVIPNLAKVQELGSMSPSQRIQVGVALTNPNAAAEAAAARAVYDPASSGYHHFYTPAQWAARFSVAKSTYTGVASQLTSQGLAVVYSAPTRDYLTLSGTVAQVERTFGVSLNTYALKGGQTFHANAQAPRVPNGVSAVLGMESLSTQLPKHSAPVQSPQQTGPCVQGTCIGLVTASDLWSIYGMPATNRGRGQKIAVIGEGDMSVPVSDLRTWEARQSPAALPQVPVKEISIADDQTDTSGLLEWDLDTQAATGMAPDVEELDLYFTQSLGVVQGALNAWANDANGPLQANASFSGCESLNLALGSIQAEDSIFQQAAAEGRTLFAASGDTGGSCTVLTGNGILNTVVPQVGYPASSNWVVAVGGTELFASSGSNPHRVLEKAWEYTGGGTSLVEEAQPWQKGISVVAGRCAVDNTIAPRVSPSDPAPVCRGVPDVAAMSGDTLFNQYDITSGGSANFGAGTSLSSPLWVGMWTRVQAAAPAGGLGFAAPKLYAQSTNATADPNDFFDVSVGSNGQFTALPRNPADPSGWDYVSGLGVANVGNLMSDLTGSLTPSNTSAPIGGGGATSATGTGCGPNGTMNQPGGNEPFVFAPASVTKVVPSYSSGAQAVTVTFTAPQMSQAQGTNELDFYYFFHFSGNEYELDASYDPVMGNSFLLYSINTTTGVATQIASGLGGGFDFSAETASITMTLTAFHAASGVTLSAGNTLTGTQAASGYEYTGYSNLIDNGACSFTLM